jgi:hypothetical protein
LVLEKRNDIALETDFLACGSIDARKTKHNTNE